ncbi:integrase core domain-containing protein [Curvibacter sp. AEP1-3]|uniref:integrase core domain-containing protein n=1 Tax=Curvibacter sp. AEP1-3 TaxID=1844971 RepID=UPI000B3CE1F3
MLAELAQILTELNPTRNPAQNVNVERSNGTCRTEVLDCFYFDSLQVLRDMTAEWLPRSNHHRPHKSLSSVPPVEHRLQKFPKPYF